MKKLKSIILIVLTAFILTGIPVATPLFPYEVAEATTVALNKKEMTLYIGNSYTLKLNGVSKGIKWTSSKKSIATVTSSGKVTGVKKGTATITATVGSKKYTCKVTVKDLSISNKSLTLNKAESKTIKINGATDKVTWKSSDKKIVTVDSKGKVVGVAEGKAKIYGKHKGKTYTCTVTVLKGKIQADVTELTISEEKMIYIKVDDLKEDEQLDFEIENSDIIDAELGEWSEATIPLNIIPIAVGTSTITITTDYKSEELIIRVTVIEKEVPETPVIPEDPTSPEVPAIPVQGSKLTSEEIYKLCEESSVQINTDISIGSGFFITENRVVTNYHVIEGARSIQIQLLNGEAYTVDTVLGYDINLDIAVLSVPIFRKPFTINTHGVTNGETVYTIGSSQGLTGTFTNGIVSTSSRVIEDVDYIQINAAITNGNSGGPLLNAYGEVMGINTMQYVEGQNLNFAINIKQLDLVNLSSPLSAEEFYRLNGTTTGTGGSGGSSSDDSEVILEDDILNNSKETAQYVPSGAVVIGTLGRIDLDYYQFTLASSTEVSSFLLCDEDWYLDNVIFGILDSNDDFVAISRTMYYNGRYYQAINEILSSGTYYVVVLYDPDYTLYGEMGYGFTIVY